MSELEKELQQMEAQYGQEFGDTSESEEEELDPETLERTNNGGGGQSLAECTWEFLHPRPHCLCNMIPSQQSHSLQQIHVLTPAIYFHSESLLTSLVLRSKLFSVEMTPICTSLMFMEEYEGGKRHWFGKGTHESSGMTDQYSRLPQKGTRLMGLSCVLTVCVISLLDTVQAEEMEDLDDCLYCPACDKSFKSDKA